MISRHVGIELAVSAIPDGASVGLGRPGPLALVRELLRQGRKDLHLVTSPTGSLAVELLIAGGAVGSLETAGVDLGELGFAPAFSRAVEAGRVICLDTTCPALLMALQAGASGVAFTPVPGLLGSDLLSVRPDFKVVDDPFRAGQKVVLVPAITPEFALVHGRRADTEGNAVIGTGRDDRLLIQAAGRAIMSVEEIRPDATAALGPREQLIPTAYLDALVVVPGSDEDQEARAYLGQVAGALQP